MIDDMMHHLHWKTGIKLRV